MKIWYLETLGIYAGRLQRVLPDEVHDGHKIPKNLALPLYKVGKLSHIAVESPEQPVKSVFYDYAA